MVHDFSSPLKTLDKILPLFAFVNLYFISLCVFGVDISSRQSSV